MIHYRKILELYFKGTSQRTICSSIGHSRQTVSDTIQKVKQLGLIELQENMTDQWLEEFLFPHKEAIAKGYYPVDWEEVHRELQKKHVTLKLLHQEYDQQARDNQKIPYAYRTFCEKYGIYAKKYKLTMPIRRKPGEILEVDWAGDTLKIQDRNTGENLPVYLYVASLPYSQFFYVEGFLDMTSTSWLTAHIHAFEFFGGVTEVLVPDNLKVGVKKAVKGDPILNEAYRELADYYHTTIVPTRVKSPKDKAGVEGNVGFISRQITASLRYYQCFSLFDLNAKVLNRVEQLNGAPFQKRPGSRKSVFNEEEKDKLLPLRQPRYQLSEWKTAKVQLNYHIQVNCMFYSVPYEYVQSQVDIRITKDLLEVYFKEVRIASHKKLIGETGQYSTNANHMPDHHRRYFEHTPVKIRTWAESLGESTVKFVDYILETHVEKKALNILMSVQNLTKYYSMEMIEEGCATLLSISHAPTLAVLKTILRRMKKYQKAKKDHTLYESKTSNDYGFVRGAHYFGGKANEK